MTVFGFELEKLKTVIIFLFNPSLVFWCFLKSLRINWLAKLIVRLPIELPAF